MRISVVAPLADRMWLAHHRGPTVEMQRDGDCWIGVVPDGAKYGLIADGPGRMTPDRVLVDPDATAVWFSAEHDRDAARPGRRPNLEFGPRAVAAAWPSPRPQRPTSRPLVVHETHVAGITRRRDRDDAGTFAAMVHELPRLAKLGVSVVELMPVHQFDPDEDNYWGYMPLVFGAVHAQYSASGDPATELADLVSAAHEHDIEIWLDVVFNHTTEEDQYGPTYNLRGLADDVYYVLDDDGTYVDEAGCGNIIDATAEPAQRLIMTALDRFADLGVDGFRFDLASVLARNSDFIRSIGDWAARRSVRLVAEAWDVVRYEVGQDWADQRWMQWNGRYRDDMRGFLRGEGGLVSDVKQRLQGSPDLFDAPFKSVNYFTSHDGFTLYDLVAYDRKHNDANGQNGVDGADDNRSWNCGWEGDEGVLDEVMTLRRRQLRNAWTLLMLSHGAPMHVAGDEFARTQFGNNNPFNQDNETSWIDWNRRGEWIELEGFVARLIAFRAEHDVLTQTEWWGSSVEWFGSSGSPDLAEHSRSIAWHLPGLYVMANMWWEPLDFEIQAHGVWRKVIDTNVESGFTDPSAELDVGRIVTVGPRSIIVLTEHERSGFECRAPSLRAAMRATATGK